MKIVPIPSRAEIALTSKTVPVYESRKAWVLPRHRAIYAAVQPIPRTLHRSTVGNSVIN